MRRHFPSIRIATLFAVMLSSGCATAPASSGGESSPGQGETAFGNYLVLAIADNYNNRAQFERTVVSKLKAENAEATAYYVAAGGNTPVDKDAVADVLATGDYDALLVTRVLAAASEAEIKPGSAAAKATRRDGGPLDFFRYDYEELDEPAALELSTEATLSVELYRATDTTRVWSTELTSKDESNIGAMIDDVADKVVTRLARDRRISR